MMFWSLESCVCLWPALLTNWGSHGELQCKQGCGGAELLQVQKEFDSKRQAHLEFYLQIKSHYFFLITQEEHVSTSLECNLNNFIFNTRRCLLRHKLQRHFSFLLKEWQMGHFCQHFGCWSAHRDGVAGGNSGTFLFCTLFFLPVSLWKWAGGAWMLKMGMDIDKINLFLWFSWVEKHIWFWFFLPRVFWIHN